MTDPIKAKIQELCPDVMELKFGCELKGGGIRTTIYDRRGTGNGSIFKVFTLAGNVFYSDAMKDGLLRDNSKSDLYEILGSPITLAVVLRAIEKVDKQVAITARGQFLLVLNGAFTHEPPHTIWNLEHDNYDQQSDECKQFIGSLLGV